MNVKDPQIQYSKIKSSIIAGLMEVLVTHPIDYIKTLSQNGNSTKNILSKIIKNPYLGVQSRLIGVIPMRIIFWNTLNYFQKNNYSPISTGVLTASIQTIIDYPIEQLKIQCMINKKNVNQPIKQTLKNAINNSNIYGFITHLSRNILFASTFTTLINNDPNSYYLAAIAGFSGAIISHPLDSLKTWYQIGNTKYPKLWTTKDYFKGWHHRSIISLISMNIGWFIFNKFNDK